MRTQEEIKREIEQWEQRKFYNNMVDHWSNENRDFDRECTNNISKLQEELKQYEGI